MINILHVSDFHFNINQEVSKKRLDKLVDAINKSDLKIDIIVFSGDIIDARIIKNQCIENSIDLHKDLFDKKKYSLDNFDSILLEIKKENLIKEFTKLLIDVTSKEFSKAKSIFEQFYKKLNVNLEDIILCCGNHDRVRIIGESDKCLKERMIDERIFSCFNQFCQSLGLSYGANTTVHTSKGYNFIIANSNWNLKDKKSVCFNCQELQPILSELDNNKSRNIFVSHQPISDFCENQKINYSFDLYNMGVEATIKEKCGTLLFGDKHGRQINDFDNLECICGAPLHSDFTTYNILKCIDDLEKGKPFLYKSVVWNKNNDAWDILPCNSELKSSFSESYNQFSKLTQQYLGENFNFDNRQTLNTDKVSQLFKLICKIKESEKSTKILSSEDNIFEYTVNLIENNIEFNNTINLKGMPKMGKTFYLNILYLTMFNQYVDGKSKYFPIYFNIDKLITDEINTYEQFYEEVNCKFDLLIEKIDKVNKKYDCKVLLLIDGLNQKNVFKQNNDIIEKILFKKIKTKNNLYYILTFNISNFPNQNYCINNIDIKCKYLIYFNLIDVVLIDQKSTKIENIIQLLSDIFNVPKINNIKDFYKKILSLHTCNLDLRTLYRYIKYHSSISDEINLDINIKALKEDFDRIVKFDEEYSCECAYYLLMSGQTYDKYSKIPFHIFWKLKNNTNLLFYMTANYYIKEIENYIEYQNQDIFTDSILVRFIPRSIALLIRKILSINKSDNILGKFIDLMYDKDISIPHITHSMLFYLVGHISNDDMFNKVNKLKSSDIVGMSKEKRDFFEFCKERSKKIAKILHEKSTSKNDEENELISSLLKDCKFRENNRLYQILYYGDNTFEGLNNRSFNFSIDVVQHGFDFHNTFLTLIAKMDYYNVNSSHSYYLKEFDLFTLCDFLYSRLSCTRVQGSDKYTLFYYSGYNNETSRIASNILKRYEELLSDFTKNNNSYNMIYIYFKKILSIIKITKKKLDDKYPQKENLINPYIHSSFEFEKILKIENLSRIGWNIQSSNIINERSRKLFANKKTKETIAEHILESVYIALMFLPEKLPDNFNIKDREEYDKNKIIILILLHELGKFDILDFTPKSEDSLDLEAKSKNSLLGLLTLGATSDFTDLSNYYTEMHSCLNGNNINSNFFQQINIIQREYKYRKLLKNGKINFNSDRKREFENSFNIELNDICEKIKNILIDTNPNLKIE